MTSQRSAAAAAAANGPAPPPAWASAMGVASLLPQQPLSANFLSAEATPLASELVGARSEPPPTAPGNPAAVKEIIRRGGCTLFPQSPELPPPSTRPRPPGCKTVFVGGLPENAGDDIIREVFSPCGDIMALRKSKKNFCHIRFSHEFMVDEALRLSGYRLRLGSSADKKDSGKIHVDFAQARDDLYEWECKQRLLQREKRHRERQDGAPPPPTPASPPLMPPFSEHGAAVLAECLKDKHRFSWAASVLLWWLDGGQVTRASANHVYALLQSANAHAARLRRDAAQQRRALRRARAAFRGALATILVQLDQVSSVLVASSRQKSRDHFSKAQRKNIDMWTRQCQADSEDVSSLRCQDEDRDEDEDEDEDDEGPSGKKMKMMKMHAADRDGAHAWRAEAFEEEAELLSQEAELQSGEPSAPLRRMQQVLSLGDELASEEAELQRAGAEAYFLEGAPPSPSGWRAAEQVDGWRPTSSSPPHAGRETGRGGGAGAGGGGAGGVLVSEKEALLLGVMSAFLHVHPFGANLEYLCSYVHTLDSQVSSRQLERLMGRLPLMFRQELSGVGATLEKRWKFCGFDSLRSG